MPFHKKKIFLYIDDDRSMLMITKQILTRSFSAEELGFHEAFSGEDGLNQVSTLRPDIVLSDIETPGINGFQVCSEIRSRNPKTAIILTSAYDAEQDNSIKAKEAGANAYLAKPIKKGELLFIVEFIFRVAQLTDIVFEKNRHLEESLDRVKTFHKKLVALNEERQTDKKRLNMNLREMAEFNSQLENKNNQISGMMQEISGFYESTVSLLANIIEMNRLDHGHSERVAEMSVYIAEKLWLNDYQVQNVKVAARIHELGIVGLPSTQEKETVIQGEQKGLQSSHPLVGEMLLKSYPGFELIADIIRHLYENVDGSGSPDGLCGDTIPIGARIVAAASYYDHVLIGNSKDGSSGAITKMEEQVNIIFDDRVFHYLKEFVANQETSPKERFLECAVFNLSEGMELAADIFSESGINLLRKDTVLNKETLSKILKFNNVDPIVGPIKIKQR